MKELNTLQEQITKKAQDWAQQEWSELESLIAHWASEHSVDAGDCLVFLFTRIGGHGPGLQCRIPFFEDKEDKQRISWYDVRNGLFEYWYPKRVEKLAKQFSKQLMEDVERLKVGNFMKDLNKKLNDIDGGERNEN